MVMWGGWRERESEHTHLVILTTSHNGFVVVAANVRRMLDVPLFRRLDSIERESVFLEGIVVVVSTAHRTKLYRE